jgi:murein L,D-transpeptidase YcbB/YkuD
VIEHPRAEELVEAVAAWIDSVRPDLNPRDAFLARVAANALSVVRRELVQGQAAEAAASARLAALLGQEGSHAELTVELCARLRSGDMDRDTPGLLAALKANVRDQIAIDQPGYVPEPPRQT